MRVDAGRCFILGEGGLFSRYVVRGGVGAEEEFWGGGDCGVQEGGAVEGGFGYWFAREGKGVLVDVGVIVGVE